MIKCLRVVLQDESFKIKTPAVIKAREAAEKFLAWCLLNTVKTDVFCKQLMQSLQTVISNSAKKSFTYSKEKLWREFYLMRSSKAFIKNWQDFLPTTAPPVEPVLYQHLTDLIFKSLLHKHFKIEYLDEEAKEMNRN